MPGRTAMVTGGRRGIGRGIAYALADAGFDIIVSDLEYDKEAEETLSNLASRGVRSTFLQADVRNVEGHAELTSAAFQAFGDVHCLVNNAGISVKQRGDLLNVSASSFDDVMATNLRGPFFLTQHVAKRMLVRQESTEYLNLRSIVNISSVSAETVSIERGEYCVSKAGVSMMTKLFAVRLATSGISVFEVRPGIIRTEMTAVVKDKYDKLIDEGLVPTARWGEPADVGRVVSALASGVFSFSSGETINVDGGLNISRL